MCRSIGLYDFLCVSSGLKTAFGFFCVFFFFWCFWRCDNQHRKKWPDPYGIITFCSSTAVTTEFLLILLYSRWHPFIHCKPWWTTKVQKSSTGLTLNYKINMGFLINNNKKILWVVYKKKNGFFPRFHSHSHRLQPSLSHCLHIKNLLLFGKKLT